MGGVGAKRGRLYKTLFPLGIIIAALFLAACSSTPEPAPAPAAPVQPAAPLATAQPASTAPAPQPTRIGGTVVMATEHPQATVPLIATNIVEEYANSLIYNGLTRPDPITLASTPELAESWETLDGGLNWTFNLRPDVTWSDGEPLVAEDVKFSWQFYCNPDVPGNADACEQGFNVIVGADDYIDGNASEISGIKVLDDNRFSVEMKEIYSPFLSLTTQHFILPSHALKDIPAVDMGQHDYALGKGTIGTGPFVMDSWTQNERFVVQARTDYWEGRPELDTFVIQWCLGDQRSTAFTQMKVGEVDLMAFFCNMPHDFVAEADADPNIEFTAFRGTSVFVVEFNLNTPPFGDKRMRQALGFATNRDALGAGLYSGRWLSHPFLTPPAFTDLYDSNVSVPDNDLDKMAELLGELGYSMGSDGLYEDAQGETISFELAHYPSAFQFGPALQAQWKDAGIDVKVQGYEWAAFFFPIYLEGKHGALAQGDEAGLNFAPIVPWMNTLSTADINGWPNAQLYRDLIKETNTTIDPAIQARNFKELQRMMAEDQYVLYTGWPDDLWGHNADLVLPEAVNGKVLMRYLVQMRYSK